MIAAWLPPVVVRQRIAPVRALMPTSKAPLRLGTRTLPVPMTSSPCQYAGLVRDVEPVIPV